MTSVKTCFQWVAKSTIPATSRAMPAAMPRVARFSATNAAVADAASAMFCAMNAAVATACSAIHAPVAIMASRIRNA